MNSLGTQDLNPVLQRLKDELAINPKAGEADHLEAVVAILLWEEARSGLQTLLVQRVEREGDPWSGQIGLPGGRIKKAESPRDAIRREVEEEVGIKLETIGFELGTLPVGHPMRRTEMGVQPWVYGLRTKPEIAIGDEIAGSFWVNLAELPRKKGTSTITIRDWTRNVDAFLIEGKVVWGFTYRVLSEFLPILNFPS